MWGSTKWRIAARDDGICREPRFLHLSAPILFQHAPLLTGHCCPGQQFNEGNCWEQTKRSAFAQVMAVLSAKTIHMKYTSSVSQLNRHVNQGASPEVPNQKGWPFCSGHLRDTQAVK